MTARGNLLRHPGRGRLLSVLETPALLTRVDVASDGRLQLETQDWVTYWAPVMQLDDAEIDRTATGLPAGGAGGDGAMTRKRADPQRSDRGKANAVLHLLEYQVTPKS